jgi:riboflavin biosynthesis pyrimidine reductase
MRRLLPSAGTDEDVDLLAAYAYPASVASRPWMRANMVASADGASSLDGLSGGLGSAGDRRIFSLLRGLADAILVGASTVRVEGYRGAQAKPHLAAVREEAGQPEVPAIAVVSRSLDLDFASPLFTEPLVPTVVFTTDDSPADRRALAASVADVVVAGEQDVDLGVAVDALAQRGYTRLLSEGGPALLAHLVEVDRLDELCLTVSPMFVSGLAKRIIDGSDSVVPHHLQIGHLLEEDGFLFLRYEVSR